MLNTSFMHAPGPQRCHWAKFNCEVGLLIGYNCSRAMAPRRVILRGNEEPCAIQMDLGWSILGRSSPSHYSLSTSHLCHRITVKELPPAAPVDVICILESDFKDGSEHGKTVSQGDIAFLNMVEEGIWKNIHGHHKMYLPFKTRPSLPDNKISAMIHLNHLKRKLQQDEKWKDQCVKLMEEVIERGDAELIEDSGSKGKKWYIPHHCFRHAKKPDILRVVFNCSARYKGTSLIDHLLSGPDMLNSLSWVLICFRKHPIVLMCAIEKMFHQLVSSVSAFIWCSVLSWMCKFWADTSS